MIAVLHAEDAEDFERVLDDQLARQDDAWWARFIVAPFDWTRFTKWWVSRRYIVPRDARKR